ncbi:MAG TPA: hypothetical protein VJO53_14580 [Candidatus Acidoferrales bacterium]|nr:hypothetical protein [Candidatus Acidoferrales bacterium]
MAKRPRGRRRSVRKILAAHSDAIRIVPLHPKAAAEVAATGAPQLTYRNGPLMASVEVFTVFWGAAWNSAPQDAMMQEMNQFFDFILASALMDQLGEYSVANFQIGRGKRTGTIVLTSPVLGTSVTDSAIQSTLQDEIANNGAFPKISANTLYFIFVPPGVKVIQGGAGSCTAFCGYHNDINGEIFYAVMPFPGCSGCTGGLQPVDALTSTSSHELCEAVTDPIPGEGWYDDANGEIGDICAWQTKTIGKYTVQLEWSNKAGKCI